MSHGKTPLILMAALALPGAAHALGLGEIHVDSALNQPLAAEIDIVGATAEDLAGITASVADRETFLRFGADRPVFLSSIVFKVARDSRGRPVLAIRSTDSFTDPLINILIDLRWHSGELIRQYTLLLDPAMTPSPIRVAEATPLVGTTTHYAKAAALPTADLPAGSAAVQETLKTVVPVTTARKTLKVGAKATLRGVAWRVGSRSDADLRKMMIAIFRANPSAFEGNINRLRRGAVLTIPSPSEVSAISMAEANRDIRAQMETWHASNKIARTAKLAAPAVAAPVSAPREAATLAEPAVLSQESTSKAIDGAEAARGNNAGPSDAEVALNRRVQVLEKGLSELQGLLDRERERSVAVQAGLTPAGSEPAATIDPATHAKSGLVVGWIIAALALATSTFGLLHVWRRRRMLKPQILPAKTESPKKGVAQTAAEVAKPAPLGEASPTAPAPNHLYRDERFEARLQQVRDEYRQSIADSSPPKRTIPEPEAPDSVDVKSLEASYLLEEGSSLQDTVIATDSYDTAKLPSVTAQVCVDDANADTMPVETARLTAQSVTSAPEPAGPDEISADLAAIDTTKLDYNLNQLDVTVHHVQMPSMLHESVPFQERRTSLVDVLKKAVEREPSRRDLRMKLLETYYAAAAINRQGFLEAVQRLARERGDMTDDEWDKIAWMGRQIAPDNDLFSPDTRQANDEDLADCA